ncbi:MAG: hypothetical protein JNN05_00815 [Candidatus Omnitrophica bacterium]|nr:hypothetical protein [Candidatus Omnitrophota bacterium]
MSQIIITVLLFLILCTFYWVFIMKGSPSVFFKKRAPQRKPTMFDVRRLLQEQDREGAIKMYIEIFRVSYRKAKKDVEELERNLKV